MDKSNHYDIIDMAYLTPERQAKIDGVINTIKTQTDDYYPRVSLDTMARGFGILVYEGDLTSISGSLSGLIRYSDPESKTRPVIFIEKSMSAARKKFTLAHELGHHFLHKGLKLRLDNLDYSRNDRSILEESEANYFAAALLMPRELVTSQIKKNKSIEEIADYFKVSKTAARNRVKWVLEN